MKYNKQILYLFFISLFMWSSNGYSQSENSGTFSALFLRADLSPRVSGLGQSFVAMADDENALLYNTAGLANLRFSSIAFNHTTWIEDISFENILASYKINDSFGIGLGISFLNMPSIQGRLDANTPTESIDVTSNVIQLGVGYVIRTGYNVGLGLKYFSEDLAGYKGNGIAFDFGYLMKTWLSGLYFGLAVQNIAGEIKYLKEAQSVPLVIRSGLTYKLPMRKLNFLLDIVKPDDQDVQVNFGTEWSFEHYFTLRVGNQSSAEKPFAPTFGFGLNYGEGYFIDYTFDNSLELGATHRAGITFRFNIPGSTSITTIKPIAVKIPTGLKYTTDKEKLVIKWDLVPGATYNVYVKPGSKDVWKKIKFEVSQPSLELKKPSPGTKYFLSVTAVLNGEESAFSDELEIISE